MQYCKSNPKFYEKHIKIIGKSIIKFLIYLNIIIDV